MSISEYLNKKYYGCGYGSFLDREAIGDELLIDEEEAKLLYRAVIGIEYFPERISFERLILCIEAFLAYENFGQ